MPRNIFDANYDWLWYSFGMRMALLFVLLFVPSVQAQVTHYRVKLTPDFDHQLVKGEETIEFHHGPGEVEWRKQPGLLVSRITSRKSDVTVSDRGVSVRLRTNGIHRLHLQFTAAPARGLRWYPDHAGLDTAFYCEAWMVCDNTPGQRATLTLEVILPSASGMKAVGPGSLQKQWGDEVGEHFRFAQNDPVQTYLFSFAVARLRRTVQDKFILYTLDKGPHPAAMVGTADAYAFLRNKAGVDLIDSEYTEAFLPLPSGQEAAGLALMSDRYLGRLEREDNVAEMTHELAHQWWGVLVGIRSWSDFWLNEGMATFMTDAFLEQRSGRAAYDREIAMAREGMKELRAEGKDRPLHWEAWKDANEALGDIPYLKGTLFLDRLRTELGEENFWRGIALYTSRNARRFVDSKDFEYAMEKASGRDLKALFDEAVYH